jgi:tetratricopeptide (TPR) repeat protein
MLRAFAARSCAARGFSRPAAGLLRAPSLRLLSAEAQPRRGTYEAPTEEKQLAKLQPRIAELYRKGRYKEALKVGEECHALALAAFGKLHPAVASMCNNLALMHKSLGDTDAAAALYKEALDCYRVVVGEEHASTATAACNLALLIRDTDAARLQEAQALLEGALQTRRVLLGEGHLTVAATMGHLASVVKLDGADGRERAKVLLEQALAASTVHWAKPGESAEADLQRASLLHSTGLLHKEAGELSAAEEAWSQAAEIRLGWLGEKHPLSVASQRDLHDLR